MKVICFGDSNTYGYDPRSYLGDRYPAECRWVDLLARKTGWKIQNQGQNGREIPRTLCHFPQDLDLLIVMLGTNDLLQSRSSAEIYSHMEWFLSNLDLRREKLLLIAPPPLALGEWVREEKTIERSVAFARGCASLAGRLGIRFADAGQWNVALTFDGVHFSEDGHRAFTEGLYHYLNKGV